MSKNNLKYTLLLYLICIICFSIFILSINNNQQLTYIMVALTIKSFIGAISLTYLNIKYE